MIESLWTFILDLIRSVINIIFLPIDALMVNIIPDFVTLSSNIQMFFNYFTNLFTFVLDWIHIPPLAITLILSYITFRVTLHFSLMTIKLFVRWYKSLKA